MTLSTPSSADFDVAVIGGGPAGAVCAYELTRDGKRVTLIYRDSDIQSPIELISGRARRFLEDLLKRPILDLVSGLEVSETVSVWGSPTVVAGSLECNE